MAAISKKRLRLCLEILQAVRDAVGGDYTLGVRLNADEMHPRGGLTITDTQKIARRLETTGLIDFLDLSIGTFYNLYLVEGSMHMPLAYTVPLAAAIRSKVSLPVFATNRINDPHLAERILAEGHADMIGMVRALICDPYLMNKAREGRTGDIRHCIADNQGCIGRMGLGYSLGCIQNPAVGKESVWGEGTIAPAKYAKKVLVIGAGPAGLEAARVLALRGHTVVLVEKNDHVGGQNIIAARGSGRQEIEGVTRWLSGQVRQLSNVELRLDVEATAGYILEENPDAVVIATGAKPKDKPFGGDYGPPAVITAWDALTGTYPIRNARVLLIDMDGRHLAASTAEFLAERGNSVHIVTPSLFVGSNLGPIQDLFRSRQRLAQKGITFTPDIAVFEIQGKVAKAVQVYSGEFMELDQHDFIVLAAGAKSDDALYWGLKDKVKELYRIGDCVAPRLVDMAIVEGHRVGRAI